MHISDWSSDVCSSDLLGDGLLLVGAGLVVEDMDLAVEDLKHVDMAGECGRAIERNVENGNGAQGGHIIGGEEEGNLERARGAIGEQRSEGRRVGQECAGP